MHQSSYLDNPHISMQFIEEAEEIKKRNELKYRWEYLGEPIGSGVVPFTNVIYREISDAEIREFDNIRQGIDWGYATDPMAFLRGHFDKKRRILYLFDEKYQVKLSNRKLAEWIIAKKYHTTTTYCDSAEPKSIDEMRDYGVKAMPANKGQGSVEFGEKWLDDLEAIVIDPKRTPKTCWEFENIDYATDKDGNTLDRLEDKDNHSIDCSRYLCNEWMRKGKKLDRKKAGL